MVTSPLLNVRSRPRPQLPGDGHGAPGLQPGRLRTDIWMALRAGPQRPVRMSGPALYQYASRHHPQRLASPRPASRRVVSKVAPNSNTTMPQVIGLHRIRFFLKVLIFSATLFTVNSVILDGLIG